MNQMQRQAQLRVEQLEDRAVPAATVTRVIDSAAHVGIRLDQVRVGDLVRLQVNMTTTESAAEESAENEPLIIRQFDDHTVYARLTDYRSHTVEFRARLDAETIDVYFERFDGDERATVTAPTVFRPDFIVTSLTRSQDGGVDIGYKTGELPIRTGERIEAEVYYASGSTPDKIIGDRVGVADGLTFSPNASGTKHIKPDRDHRFAAPPEGATHILAVIDRSGKLPESNEQNNVVAVALSTFLPNFKPTAFTESDDTLHITYQASGARTPHDQNPYIAVVWAKEVDGRVVKIPGTQPVVAATQMDKTGGAHKLDIPLSRLPSAPRDATRLMVVTDYNQAAEESSESDNTLVLSTAPLSFELEGLAPQAPTRQERVKRWLNDHRATINSVAQAYNVDARAIAGAIAWEALENPLTTSLRGAGPGKIHVTDSRINAVLELGRGSGVAQQAEDRYAADPNPARRLSLLSIAQRRQLLSTDPDAAIKYIGAIMGAYGDEADTAGYRIHNKPEILTTYYQGAGVDLLTVAAKLKKKYPAPLSYVGNRMGTWVHEHLSYLSGAVHG